MFVLGGVYVLPQALNVWTICLYVRPKLPQSRIMVHTLSALVYSYIHMGTWMLGDMKREAQICLAIVVGNKQQNTFPLNGAICYLPS